MSTKNEVIGLIVLFGGFFITFFLLVRFIESKWPSKSKVQFGRFGLLPKHTGIFFFIWLAIYLYLFSLITTTLFPRY